MSKKKWDKVQIIRLIIQLAFLAIVTIASIRHQLLGGGPKGVPPIDSLCPFGGMEALYKFIITGQFIDKLDWSVFALLGGTIILAIVAGRYFCGWICALGTMQELFGKLGFVIFKKKFEIPAKIDKPLRYLKYGVLIWALYFTWQTGTLFIRPYDPFAAYGHISAGWTELWGGFAVGLIVLIVSLVASMFYDRFFCKYACPLGGLLGIISKISIFKIKREKDSCISCSICTRKCPVNIDVAKQDKIDSAECIGCLECVSSCPTGKGTLKTTILGKNVNPMVIAIVGVAIYLGIVGIANLTGYWHTEKSLSEIAATGGELNPDNIKGYMTIKDISETYKVEMGEIYHKAEIDKSKVPETLMIKSISAIMGESDREVYIDKIKNAVRHLLGMPEKAEGEKSEEHKDTGVTQEKMGTEETDKVLKEEHKEAESKEKSEVKTLEAKTEIKHEKEVDKAQTSQLNPEDIKGFMTIKEVAEKYKVNIDEIYKVIGMTKEEMPEDSLLKAIKEKKPGFEVEEIRELVKKLQKK